MNGSKFHEFIINIIIIHNHIFIIIYRHILSFFDYFILIKQMKLLLVRLEMNLLYSFVHNDCFRESVSSAINKLSAPCASWELAWQTLKRSNNTYPFKYTYEYVWDISSYATHMLRYIGPRTFMIFVHHRASPRPHAEWRASRGTRSNDTRSLEVNIWTATVLHRILPCDIPRGGRAQWECFWRYLILRSASHFSTRSSSLYKYLLVHTSAAILQIETRLPIALRDEHPVVLWTYRKIFPKSPLKWANVTEQNSTKRRTFMYRLFFGIS